MQKLTGYVSGCALNFQTDRGRTIPVRVHFARDRLAPSLDGELAGVVEGVAGECTDTSQRGHVENQATPVVLGLAHHLNCLERNADSAEEVRFELVVHFLLFDRLGVTGQ